MGFSSGQLAQAALVGQIGGTVTSAVGSYYSAQSQASSLKFQSDIAGINSRIAELGAQSELMKGERQVGAISMKAGQVKSAQRAAMAANGIALDEGNAVEIQATTDMMKELDMNTATSNAVRSAWGYRTQSTNYQTEAAMKSAMGEGINPFGSAMGSMLGSAGGVASAWYKAKKEGALD